MELLLALRDVGIPEPLPAAINERAQTALEREIADGSHRSARRRRSIRVFGRLLPAPVALVATAAIATAATTVALIANPFQEIAARNAHDTPLRLFQRNPDVIGATPKSQWRQTVIPSTVRELGTFTLPGVATISYWTAQTRQHGICGALRLPNHTWLGTGDVKNYTGSLPGCYPTRAQVGAGALILDGFDFIDGSVLGRHGQRWDLIYGRVSTRQTPTRVIDTHSGRSASLLDGNYFAIAVHPVGNDYGDFVHLKATAANGQTLAEEGKPLPGTPTTKCVGRDNVRRVRIPGTNRFSTTWSCRKYKRVIAR